MKNAVDEREGEDEGVRSFTDTLLLTIQYHPRPWCFVVNWFMKEGRKEGRRE